MLPFADCVSPSADGLERAAQLRRAAAEESKSGRSRSGKISGYRFECEYSI